MTVNLDGIPPLSWSNGPGQVEQISPSALALRAAAESDLFNDPFGAPAQRVATPLTFTPADDEFSLSARVSVDAPRTTFDAAVLALWGDADHWAKLCFEYSPQGQALVVSVVTNGVSDDSNSTVVTNDEVFLRVIRKGAGWAFHSSADGSTWDFVRAFRLTFEGPIAVGFLSQAPTGETCVARFDHIDYRATVPSDLRNGD